MLCGGSSGDGKCCISLPVTRTLSTSVPTLATPLAFHELSRDLFLLLQLFMRGLAHTEGRQVSKVASHHTHCLYATVGRGKQLPQDALLHGPVDIVQQHYHLLLHVEKSSRFNVLLTVLRPSGDASVDILHKDGASMPASTVASQPPATSCGMKLQLQHSTYSDSQLPNQSLRQHSRLTTSPAAMHRFAFCIAKYELSIRPAAEEGHTTPQASEGAEGRIWRG